MPPKFLVHHTELLPLFSQEMELDVVKTVILSTVKESEPIKSSKELQLKWWCNSFVLLLGGSVQERLPFILEILSDEECWEETNTIHLVKLKRRVVARKLVQSHSKNGTVNPISDFERYQIACWCCLEEDLPDLFEKLKENNNIGMADRDALRNFVKTLSTKYRSEPLVGFWSHIIGSFASELRLEGMHLYEYGLHYSLFMYRQHVETVEFFLNKIKALPEVEMSAAKKHDILMKTTVRASKTPVGTYPEILEFCMSQLSPDDYPTFLEKDLETNRNFNSFIVLVDIWRFDLLQKLLPFVTQYNISDSAYENLLTSLSVHQYPDHFANEAVKLFMYMWMKEGFDRKRNLILKIELLHPGKRGGLLLPLVEKNYMDVVWAILDKARPNQVFEFLKSEAAAHIRSIFERKNDLHSMNKFLSYAIPTRALGADNSNGASTSQMDMDVDNSTVEEESPSKRFKKE